MLQLQHFPVSMVTQIRGSSLSSILPCGVGNAPLCELPFLHRCLLLLTVNSHTVP